MYRWCLSSASSPPALPAQMADSTRKKFHYLYLEINNSKWFSSSEITLTNTNSKFQHNQNIDIFISAYLPSYV